MCAATTRLIATRTAAPRDRSSVPLLQSQGVPTNHVQLQISIAAVFMKENAPTTNARRASHKKAMPKTSFAWTRIAQTHHTPYVVEKQASATPSPASVEACIESMLQISIVRDGSVPKLIKTSAAKQWPPVTMPNARRGHVFNIHLSSRLRTHGQRHQDALS